MEKRLLSTVEAAEYLALSPTTLRRELVKPGRLKPVNLFSHGRKHRFLKDDLDRLIASAHELQVVK